MKFDYSKICFDILNSLPKRQKEILSQRFGLQGKEKETLAAIGRKFGITRERVRQIEKDGILKITPHLKKYQKVFQYFQDELKKTGGLRKEKILLAELGRGEYQAQVFFLLTLGELFQRLKETEEFHPLWTIDIKAVDLAKRVISAFYQELNKVQKPLKISDWQNSFALSPKILEYFLEISKVIQKNPEGLFGLKNWPEINPKNVKDKAFLVLKKTGKPLHFRAVASLIGKDAVVQTVHNELIRDPRFVLVGRGIYALKEWGFKEGEVKDVILDILKRAQRPLTKKEILAEVLQQRLVKKNTVLLNLSNKKYFLRTSDGKYLIKEA
jgi:hypothetical protein